MLLSAVLATTLLELRTTDLAAVLGWYPPGWGSTLAMVQTDYPDVVKHEGHGCPAASPRESTFHARKPLVWIAGARPRYLDFELPPWGLEAVYADYKERATPSLFVLGPPSCARAGSALWRRRNAVIAVVGDGFGIFVAEPGSQSASILEWFACFPEDTKAAPA